MGGIESSLIPPEWQPKLLYQFKYLGLKISTLYFLVTKLICLFHNLDMLDPELAGYPEKVEAKNPLDDEIMKKFLDQDTVEKEEVFFSFFIAQSNPGNSFYIHPFIVKILNLFIILLCTHFYDTSFRYLCKSMFHWAGSLACLSLPSVMSWIRPDTPIWKLALSQSCLPRNKHGRKRVKCLFRLL